MDLDKIDPAVQRSVMTNLRTFNAHLKLQQAVLALMIHQLVSADELADQKRMFQKLDTSNDGLLQRSELIDGFRRVFGEVVEGEVDELMALADLNGNGDLDYSEWLVATSKRSVIINSHLLW